MLNYCAHKQIRIKIPRKKKKINEKKKTKSTEYGFF